MPEWCREDLAEAGRDERRDVDEECPAVVAVLPAARSAAPVCSCADESEGERGSTEAETPSSCDEQWESDAPAVLPLWLCVRDAADSGIGWPSDCRREDATCTLLWLSLRLRMALLWLMQSSLVDVGCTALIAFPVVAAGAGESDQRGDRGGVAAWMRIQMVDAAHCPSLFISIAFGW